MIRQRLRLSLTIRALALRLCQRLGLKPSYVYYIGSSEVLPPPLGAEEESELLKRLGSGDKTVRNTLIERNLRLVVYIARQIRAQGLASKTLVSIGTIGLIKAVNTFDPGRNEIGYLCIQVHRQ